MLIIKRLYIYGVVGLLAVAASCGNNQTENQEDSIPDDTIVEIDSTEIWAELARLDSLRLDSLRRDSLRLDSMLRDSLHREDSIRRVDSTAKAIEKKSLNMGNTEIENLLFEYAELVKDIKLGFYIEGEYKKPEITAYRNMILPAIELKKELDGKVYEMTAEQKTRFNKLSNSIKEALKSPN